MSEASPSKLLVVDDDEGLRRQLRWAFDGYDVVLACDRPTAVAAVREHAPSVVLLDLGLPPDPHGPGEGLATLEEILKHSRHAKVIIMTGQTEREYAVQAVGRGAYDFYQKPIEVTTLALIVDRAFKLHALEEENRRLSETGGLVALPGLVAASEPMLKICQQVRQLAPSSVSILFLGESGTGKEVFARAVHQLSTRAKERFVAINCAAIPEHLLESELFGYEKGAFTGAAKRTVGKVELANRGTLFLDEIGDMPLSLQAKLFRFLQERLIERVGGRDTIPVDTRILAATNKDLQQLIAQGAFRMELYYRLSEAVIEIPPLRERLDDVALIANHLLQKLAKEEGRPVRGFAPDAIAAIWNYAWPGNVRELENRVKRGVVAATGGKITAQDLGFAPSETGGGMTLRAAREQADRAVITRAMLEAEGNISKAAKILDISRPTLYQLLREYQIEVAHA